MKNFSSRCTLITKVIDKVIIMAFIFKSIASAIYGSTDKAPEFHVHDCVDGRPILHFKTISKKKLTKKDGYKYLDIVSEILSSHFGKHGIHCCNNVKIMNDGNAILCFPGIEKGDEAVQSSLLNLLKTQEGIKNFFGDEEFTFIPVTLETINTLKIRVDIPMEFNLNTIGEYVDIVRKIVIAEFNWECTCAYNAKFNGGNNTIEFDTIEITPEEQQELITKLQNNKWIKAFFGDTSFTLV